MKKTTQQTDLKTMANLLAGEFEADMLLYNGAIERPSDHILLELCNGRPRRKNVLLLLTTDGGSPDAAFRISRFLQDKYEKFTVIINGICKSAGTIISIGATEIAMSENGELGPLDVQIAKKDELFEHRSGLNNENALDFLQERTLASFEEYFLALNTRSGGRVTTKTAMQVARDLVNGLYGKIYDQIDPINLGEAARAMNIAIHYGDILDKRNNNLKSGALERLAKAYPSHGFVIDFEEAESLFNNIRRVNKREKEICDTLSDLTIFPCESIRRSKDPLITFISDPIQTKKEDEENAQSKEASSRSSSKDAGRSTSTVGRRKKEPK